MITLDADWVQVYIDKGELFNDLQIVYVGDGWYANGSDRALIQQSEAGIVMMVWNDRDPRVEMREALTLPEYP